MANREVDKVENFGTSNGIFDVNILISYSNLHCVVLTVTRNPTETPKHL